VSQSQIDLLLILAGHPGETVSRRNLSERLWPGQDGQDVLLDDAAYSLRELLSGSAQNRPYIVGVDGGSFMLVVQPRPAERAPALQAAATATIEQAAPFLTAQSSRELFEVLTALNLSIDPQAP
jgi:DNA-binding winged helix-turn-helix (wHTH) protein